ncbi:hypothetical protein SAMD00079811_28490 [Scytonema sp. HK-05]|uniref:hypothetical protein n=1 Tax=Scytonema sp. HK-05 TaxID=1137095 RepID=UPI0009367008|nr:hypothetical protein [Scytonema sp. HK-05]OKH53813.1 hypothetical protein NIES2130_29650 [Scytonema sp. HK-05]BAY45246.1 hypothetical protein SAMD00079811_28490 [Scytonema sp. HK-05]
MLLAYLGDRQILQLQPSFLGKVVLCISFTEQTMNMAINLMLASGLFWTLTYILLKFPNKSSSLKQTELVYGSCFA